MPARDQTSRPPRRRIPLWAGAVGVAALLAGVAPATAAPPNVTLGFAAPVAGPVADEDGEGTGFTGVQANTAGDQYLPANLDRDGGVLAVTTTTGDFVAGTNTQQNALQSEFDGTADYAVSAEIVGPLGADDDFQAGGIFVGPDQDNYVKLTAGQGSGGPRLELAAEDDGAFTASSIPVPEVPGAARLALTLEVDASTGAVLGKYSIDGGPVQAIPAGATLPDLGTASDTAGIVTTHLGAAQPITVRYDGFVVEPLESATFQAHQKIHDFGTVDGKPQYPTTLAIGPDGKLYVGTQFGHIHVFALDGDNDPTPQAVIGTIHDRPNVDFNGDPKPDTGRTLTGIAFDPALEGGKPVLYVSHSDPEIFGGAAPGGSTTDEASGTVTKLVINADGTVASDQDLVTGLPRSGENHGPNGMAIGPDGWLYLSIGGNTNAGAPSSPFSWFPEVPASGSVVRINPGAIGAGTLDVTASSTITFQNCDPGEVIGQGGCTASVASALPGSPGAFEVHATGFRNGYDLAWHSNGKLYLNDNSRNQGFGEAPGAATPPAGTCPGGAAPVTDVDDRLFLVTAGAHHGHPNPALGRCGLDDFSDGTQPIGEYDENASQTGLAEYTADSFGDLLKGQLISTSYVKNKLTRMRLDVAGDAVIEENIDLATGFNAPIDLIVAANGDILVAEHNEAGQPGDLSRVRPVVTGSGSCTPLGPLADSDGDGFGDQDEINHATARCNPADTPPDADGDLVGDLTDPNDDNDGLPDAQDDLQLDATNGAGTSLPFVLDFTTPNGGGFFGSGFGGVQLSSNGGGPVGGLVGAGGAGGFLAVTATDGTHEGGANDQANALQQGFPAAGRFRVATSLSQPFPALNPSGGEDAGLFFGPDEDNFARIGLNADNGSPIVEVGLEVGGSFSRAAAVPLPLPVGDAGLSLTGDPVAGTVTAAVAIGAEQELATMSVPPSWFQKARAGVSTTRVGSANPQFVSAFREFRIDPLPAAPGTPTPASPSAGAVETSAVARCRGVAATIEGTPGNDVIRGTRGRDVIVGKGGNDRIFGLRGNDLICGDGGNDRIDGGPGSDRLQGGAGSDRLRGQAGRDVVLGGRGDDRLIGGHDRDVLAGGPGRDVGLGGGGNDRLRGGAGNDVLNGQRGNDRLSGHGGRDRLLGSRGNDRLLGGRGDDRLLGGPGRDLLSGQAGRDRLFGQRGNDRLHGGSGRDLLAGGAGWDVGFGGTGRDRCISIARGRC